MCVAVVHGRSITNQYLLIHTLTAKRCNLLGWQYMSDSLYQQPQPVLVPLSSSWLMGISPLCLPATCCSCTKLRAMLDSQNLWLHDCCPVHGTNTFAICLLCTLYNRCWRTCPPHPSSFLALPLQQVSNPSSNDQIKDDEL